MYPDERLVMCGLMATDWTAVDKAPKAKVPRSNRVGCARKAGAEGAGTVTGRFPHGCRGRWFISPAGSSRRANEPCRSVKQAVCPKGILCSVWQSLMPHGRSSRSRREVFHGRRYLAQIGGTSRTTPRETTIGYRERPRGANLRPRPHLLSHRELVSGPFCHSKRTEADRSLSLI